VRFVGFTTGVSLWKDLRLGPVTLSGGARLALLGLSRSFPGRPDLPSQWFGTVTPGLTGAAAWRLGDRLSAVARARAHYLLYTVDRNMSLAYVELLFGVEYALGE